ncbi:MAG: serine protease [Hyphomicrobiales bacterium]
MQGIADVVRNALAEGKWETATQAFMNLADFFTPGMGNHAHSEAQNLTRKAVVISGEVRALLREYEDRFISREDYKIDLRHLSERMQRVTDQLVALSNAPDVARPADEPSVQISLPGSGELEAIYGRSNLQSPAWLERGLVAAKAVVRVVTPRKVGTGFLIGGNLVMTNNHVLSDIKDLSGTSIEANYERDAGGDLRKAARYKAQTEHFSTEPAPLDCTVFSVDPLGIGDGTPPLSEWGTLTLAAREPDRGEPLNIIQHPGGGVKMIAVTSNECLSSAPPHVTYLTDTQSGSSGAPVFDGDWNVLALHRAGDVPTKLQNGRFVRANQGVLISSLRSCVELSF